MISSDFSGDDLHLVPALWLSKPRAGGRAGRDEVERQKPNTELQTDYDRDMIDSI